MKGPGMLIGNFELNLLRKPTWAWASLLLTPQIDKFQHNWLNKRSMSFCLKTEMGEGLFCLLCKKHDTSNPQNKSKFEDHCRTSQHMNAVSAEMLQRVSVFQRTLDENHQ